MSSASGDVVFIIGVTGMFSAALNGTYDRTAEVSGGYPV